MPNSLNTSKVVLPFKAVINKTILRWFLMLLVIIFHKEEKEDVSIFEQNVDYKG